MSDETNGISRARSITANSNKYPNNYANIASNNGAEGRVDERDRKSRLVKEWESLTDDLDELDVELLLSEARKKARIRVFARKLNEHNKRPQKYDQSPRSVKLPDFIQAEWIDRGFIPTQIDRVMLAGYDDKLVRAIENYEFNNGPLPDKMQFPRVGSKRSKKHAPLQTHENLPNS